MEPSLPDSERDAWNIIRGQKATPEQVLVLEKVLRGARKFGLARKILDEIKDDPVLILDANLRNRVAQKRALCTYKDPDLEPGKRLVGALRILEATDDFERTKDQETLGLTGAIYKRMWENSAQQRQLEMSLAYYYRGYQQGIIGDYGYTAINAAFVLDLLADIESVATPSPVITPANDQRRALARTIRGELVAQLPALAQQPGGNWLETTWWFLVTLGEAYFGLDDCANADAWLQRAAKLDGVADWEQETTARQLAALVRIKENLQAHGGPKIDPCVRATLLRFLGKNAAADSVVRGKVGLALSGGGFRASFYHIGVLAKLAEADLLRHVEYLSCVSGGSIVGTHFYLEVRNLLEQKADTCVRPDDYIEIVHKIAKDFLDGVNTNIRTQIAAEWWTNLKMIFLPAYSRTKRAGELYEAHIYSRVADGLGDKKRWLSDLKVIPKGESPGFSPKDNNWRRAAKVPILVLNATTLNTGHNWQFTATWMGEPPGEINTEVDANYRLRRLYFETDAPPDYQRVRLGYAVAASACVPGIFEPLSLTNLYERDSRTEHRKVRPVVRLVDGGVYDNQGVAALLEQGCAVLLVSDASGQMDERDYPSNGLLGVPLRSNSILQSRVRVSQYADLSSRQRGGLLKGLMFVHLKKDLEIQPVDWINCQEPSKPLEAKPLLPYGVQRHIQRQLAAIRTDLDSFSEAEAYALMTSGYLMTEHSLSTQSLGFPVVLPSRQAWSFLAIEPLMKQADPQSPLMRQLRVANSLFFKVWLLMRELQILGGILIVILAALLGYAAYLSWEGELFRLTVKQAVVGVAAGGLLVLALSLLSKLVNYRKSATEILIGIGMTTVGFALARLHLHVFDKIFLWQGSLRRLLAKG